ncbi:MAG: creatininase family protein [candidate division Zixibacteria bacterium]|nr:creatininase family protein [candidate division Zixibacteria bacterium]
MSRGSQPENPAVPPTSEHLVRLEEITAPRLAELAAQNAVVVLPISPLEEHGPHLPMGTDIINAQYFAQMAGDLIRELEPKAPVVLAPTIPLGTHAYRFMGTINIRQRVIRDLVIDYGRSLAEAGFRRLLIVSAHGGPGHIVALDEAATILTRRHAIRTVNLTSQIIYQFLAGHLKEQVIALAGEDGGAEWDESAKRAFAMDYHAGWWETAMMLWLRPELVDPSYTTLPEALIPRWRLRSRSPLLPPAGQGYLGAPGRADAQFAAATIVVLQEQAWTIIGDFLAGRGPMSRHRAPLYWVPTFRTNFRIWIGVGLLVLVVGLWYFVLRHVR